LNLKKINKSVPPNTLTQFFNINPHGSWEEDFRHHNSGQDYKSIKGLIFSDQGEICAYCERSLKNNDPHKKCIEHYHSKSDKSTPNKNWGLDWQNVIGVCLGGSDTKEIHPLPSNLSCDRYKSHLENKKVFQKQCEGYILDPLDMVATPPLFRFNKATGELEANTNACNQYVPKNNAFNTTTELVSNTIKVFNLNCDRLLADRLAIFHQYERQIKSARQKNDTQIHGKLAKAWFHEKWPSFFTTRRLLLDRHAEEHLNILQYNG